MSEVKRYVFQHVVRDGTSRSFTKKVQQFTLAADFDRVTAERDALQVLLTAADERDDQRKELLQMFIDNSGDKDVVELCMHALNTAEVDDDA